MITNIISFSKKHWKLILIGFFLVLFLIYFLLYRNAVKDLNTTLVRNNVLDRIYKEKTDEFEKYRKEKEADLVNLNNVIENDKLKIQNKENKLRILNANIRDSNDRLVEIEAKIQKQKQIRINESKKTYTPEELDSKLISILRN